MSTKDKPGPLSEPASAQSPLRNSKTTAFVVFLVILSLLAWHIFDYRDHGPINDVCPQVSELLPGKNYELWDSLSNTYSTDSFKLKAINWLSGAVQVP